MLLFWWQPWDFDRQISVFAIGSFCSKIHFRNELEERKGMGKSPFCLCEVSFFETSQMIWGPALHLA